MNKPLSVDLPHSLGKDEAKRRMASGIGRLNSHIPGGNADVKSSWQGDRMHLEVRAMGQEVTGYIDVEERKVHLELMVPAFLALFGGAIEKLIRKEGTDLLDDKSKRS